MNVGSTSTGTDALAVLTRVSAGYGRNVPVVSGVDWALRRGEAWGVIGANGSGKTTLIRTLMGLLKPSEGECRVHRNIRFGYVKQRDGLHDLFPFTVREMVDMGRMRGRRLPSDRDDRMGQALETTGLVGIADMPVRELSGGQKQRVLIARALVSRPDVLVLDEPTNDMDVAGEQAILGLITRIRAETGCAVLMVSHLLHAVLQISEQLLIVHEGTVHTHARDEAVHKDLLSSRYGIPVTIRPGSGGGLSVEAIPGGGGGV